ncbi:MAG: hypothetical protein JWP35_3869 [Caulobacter sp.]|nr:hypothetical protein [Caulobacter sp.]
MAYVITGLDAEPFRPLFGLPDEALATHGAVRRTVDAKPGFPCRITLEDAEPGETVLLLNHEYQSADSPYRGRHAIYVREGGHATARITNAVPPYLAGRLISLRAFDDAGMMVDADVVEGRELEPLIARLFSNTVVAYLHVHNAKRGCYAARIDRG